jgi:putative ABC transport system permease protein
VDIPKESGETFASIAAGLVIGALLAAAAAAALAARLFGVAPADPISLGGAAALVAGVALMAACAPAYRATRIDPATALRDE